ncbi:hypothetical protein AB3Y40_06915 [Yoonia sp. R2331]|uniref:hypothetical protein n=1 Tax=Yoonia sp. R2331 TaxID=3237238 RepID=UPI0034E52105
MAELVAFSVYLAGVIGVMKSPYDFARAEMDGKVVNISADERRFVRVCLALIWPWWAVYLYTSTSLFRASDNAKEAGE